MLDLAGAGGRRAPGAAAAQHLQQGLVRVQPHGEPNMKSMSTLVARGNWNIAKGRMKQVLARLMHDNLQFMEGKADELVGRIQKRKGQARERREAVPEAADEDGSHQ